MRFYAGVWSVITVVSVPWWRRLPAVIWNSVTRTVPWATPPLASERVGCNWLCLNQIVKKLFCWHQVASSCRQGFKLCKSVTAKFYYLCTNTPPPSPCFFSSWERERERERNEIKVAWYVSEGLLICGSSLVPNPLCVANDRLGKEFWRINLRQIY
jgi:hypothetical protein